MYKHSPCKKKRVMTPSQLYNGNDYFGKTVSYIDIMIETVP